MKALARAACRNVTEEQLAAIWEVRQGSGKTHDEGATAVVAATALDQLASEMETELLETDVVEYGAHLVEIAKEYEIKKKRRQSCLLKLLELHPALLALVGLLCSECPQRMW